VHDFVKVHAKAKGNYRGLPKKFREALAFQMIWVRERKPVDEAAEQSEWRRISDNFKVNRKRETA
jgi:SH3-like domain-containing protein